MESYFLHLVESFYVSVEMNFEIVGKHLNVLCLKCMRSQKGTTMKIKENILKTELVDYSYKQEKMNFITHLIGVPLGILIFIASIVMIIIKKVTTGVFIGLTIFSFTAILLYFVSASYHLPNDDENKKRAKRIVDHCTIYALIAGTYTPICIWLYQFSYFGLYLLIAQWVLAIIGIALNAYNLNSKVVKTISMILYIAMGWMVLYTTAFTLLPTISFALILSGGIVYTIGSVLYGIGHSNKWFHPIFHIFVLIGTILQAIGVFFLFF